VDSAALPRYVVRATRGAAVAAAAAFAGAAVRGVLVGVEERPRGGADARWGWFVPPGLGGAVHGREAGRAMERVEGSESAESGSDAEEEGDDDFEEAEEEDDALERDDYNAEMYFDNGEDEDLEGGEEGGGFDYD